MLDFAQRAVLYKDILTWLDSSPSQEEILTYVRHLPDQDSQVLLAEVGGLATERLYEEKKQYFLAHSGEDFLRQVTETDQLFYVFSCTAYNAKSVSARLARQYPRLSFPGFADDMRAWATSYWGKWRAVLRLVTASHYLTLSIYANSLVAAGWKSEELQEIGEVLKQQYLEEGQLVDGGELLSEAQVEERRQVLLGLGFLPKEHVEALLQPSSGIQRSRFQLDLIILIGFLLECGEERARAGLPEFNQAVWDKLVERESLSRLTTLEARRQAEIGPMAKSLQDLLKWLYQVWAVAYIMNGQTAEAMSKAVLGATASQRELLCTSLNSFLQNSFIVEALLQPLDHHKVVARVMSMRSYVQFSEELSDIVKGVPDEDRRMAASKLLGTIYKVMQAFATASSPSNQPHA